MIGALRDGFIPGTVLNAAYIKCADMRFIYAEVQQLIQTDRC